MSSTAFINAVAILLIAAPMTPLGKQRGISGRCPDGLVGYWLRGGVSLGDLMYRRAKIALCVLVVSYSADSAAAFAPKVDDVCVPLDALRGKLVVDRDALLAQLIQTAHGINTHMMGVRRAARYTREVDILLNPLDLCLPSQLVNGAYGGGQQEAWRSHHRARKFLGPALHRKRPRQSSGERMDHSSKLAVSPTDDQHFSQATIERHLRASIDHALLTCTKATQNAGGGAGAGAGAGGQGGGNAGGSIADGGSAPDPTAPFIALRQIPSMISSTRAPCRPTRRVFRARRPPISHKDRDDTFSTNIQSPLIHGLGYVFPRRSFDDARNFIGQFAPFITYDQQFIQTNSPDEFICAEPGRGRDELALTSRCSGGTTSR